jgi:Pyruvate/2-oxoacid:ferredoxin oxidoreductase delta subunit
MAATNDKPYRDELVDIIKDIGQELIDRAEEMVSEDATFIRDFNINIDIPNPREEDPTITWSHSTLCTNFLNRKDPGLGLKSKSVKEKATGYWMHEYNAMANESCVRCSNCYYIVKSDEIGFLRAPDTCPGCHATMEPKS